MKYKNRYLINQCALYKIGSKARLAKMLKTEVHRLLFLADGNVVYRSFLLPEMVCEFTGKVTKKRRVHEPDFELRRIHERILKLLQKVVVPDYAHAAVKNRSYRTNALAHVGQCNVATFDICTFYSSTRESRVYSFFADQLKCAPDVAKILMRLTCYSDGLPTGSPLSPLLSLFVNLPLFDALENFANTNSLKFTCYIDDLTFSGNQLPSQIKYSISNLVENYGHKINKKKTRIFKSDYAKHVTGVVLYSDSIQVPHTRFWKARAIEKARSFASSPYENLKLTEKLAGLLGEAAYLDCRFRYKARKANLDLKVARKKILDAGKGKFIV